MTRLAATPDGPPWHLRRHGGKPSTRTRTSFEVDCDRIVHSESFRDLQHKTQVQGLAESPAAAFRTRLNHVIEVTQLAAGIASDLEVNEALARAIALAHDLGHPPFGHAGERALDHALRNHGEAEWNANTHSLAVVDEIECAFIDFRGLNLTWATREGVARHSTRFDVPVDHHWFGATPNAGIESQIVDLADTLAYLSHDLDDAIRDGFVSLDEFAGAHDQTEALVAEATNRWSSALSPWPPAEEHRLVRRFIVAKLIGHAIADIVSATRERAGELHVERPASVREAEKRTVVQSPDFEAMTQAILDLLVARYYRSDQVADSDARAEEIMLGLFDWYLARPDLIPKRFHVKNEVVTVANFLASLNDVTTEERAIEAGVTANPAENSTARSR